MILKGEIEALAKYIDKGHGDEMADHDPSSTGIIAKLRSFNTEDVRASIERANETSKSWARYPAPKRGQILLKSGELMESEKEKIAELMTLEEGKTLKDSMLEVERSAFTLKFYGAIAYKYGGKTLPSADADTMIMTVREPLGTVSLITPWNFPLSIPVWKIGPALASGNAVIIKPASKTPLIVAKMIEILRRAGLPDEVVQLVVGSGKEIGTELVVNEHIKAVSFTGSVSVGHEIYEKVGHKRVMTRVQLELGGKNALYVDKDSNLSKAAEFTIRGGFGLTGQSCTATSRLLVHETVYETLRAKILERLKTWRTGPGMSENVDMGPVVDEEQLKTDLEYIRDGEAEGAKIIHGGSERPKGLFLGPVLFEDVTPEMKIFREEIFGPVLAITLVGGVEEAIDACNSVVYGHTAGIISDNNTVINRFIAGVDAGVIKVNKPTVGLELQAPFGAFKGSGANTWKEMGEDALDFYTKEKTTYLGW